MSKVASAGYASHLVPWILGQSGFWRSYWAVGQLSGIAAACLWYPRTRAAAVRHRAVPGGSSAI